jgi:uncharacterized protein YjbI with pentapeptide repeats
MIQAELNKIHNEPNEILQQLKSDCYKCSGLCCTALFFSKMDGFPENKIAGMPCINLQKDFKCKIHTDLEKNKMKGCIGYDCFGAGQHVTQMIFIGQTWQELPAQAKEIFDVFVVVFQLYQIRYFLAEALNICQTKAMKDDIYSLIMENEAMCNLNPKDIQIIDVESYRDRANLPIKKVCSLFLDNLGSKDKKCPTDFLGKSFKNKDMRGLDLSIRLLIAANFEGCIFDGTIFLGADTRDTNFSNADLSEALFLSQGQINAARGNRNTKLPKHLEYPVTWK